MKTARIIILISLAALNAYLIFVNTARQRVLLRTTADLRSATVALAQLSPQASMLQSNCSMLVLKVNKIGFASSLFGYEACRQGMTPEKFVDLSATIFRGTNIPDIHIDIGTNEVSVQQVVKRRL